MSRVAEALKKAGMAGHDGGGTSATLDSFAGQLDAAAPAVEPASPKPAAPEPSVTAAAPAGTAVVRAGGGMLSSTPPPSAAVWKACLDNELLIISPKIDHASAHQYRRLASTLHQLQAERQLRSVLVASAVPGEGKTLTAANLAITLSESFHRRVLLIDADLRRPRLHKLFAIDMTQGLSTVLRASTDLVAPLVGISPRLSLLAGGPPDHDPVSGLASDRMRHLVEAAYEMFDWVIVDTPPLGVAPDVTFLSMVVDGVVLVVRASSTPLATVQRAVATLTPERIVGAVLNQAEPQAVETYGYYPEGTFIDHVIPVENGEKLPG